MKMESYIGQGVRIDLIILERSIQYHMEGQGIVSQDGTWPNRAKATLVGALLGPLGCYAKLDRSIDSALEEEETVGG